MIKVSVIIPVYNMETFLKECLNSVMGQTLQEKEIICINDGSTDQSLLVLEEYEQQYSNFIIINQKNAGAAHARNSGIAIAKGEFVAFMDPDDYYPDCDILEHLYNLAQKNKVKICGGSLSIGDQNGIRTEFAGKSQNLTFKQDGKIRYRDYQFQYAYVRFLFQTEMIKENELYFPLYVRYQDPPFLVKAMLCAEEFYGTSKITYHYRTGHKRINFTEKIIIDVLSGIWDLLCISVKERLAYLHAYVIDDIHKGYYNYFVMGTFFASPQIKELFIKINKAIDATLLRQSCCVYSECPYISFESIIENWNQFRNKFESILRKSPAVFVYGAGNIGKTVIHYLQLESNIKIEGIAVTNIIGNAESINGISVISIYELKEEYESALFVIAVSSKVRDEILRTVSALKIKNLLILEDEEIRLMDIYINDYKRLFVESKQ